MIRLKRAVFEEVDGRGLLRLCAFCKAVVVFLRILLFPILPVRLECCGWGF